MKGTYRKKNKKMAGPGCVYSEVLLQSMQGVHFLCFGKLHLKVCSLIIHELSNVGWSCQPCIWWCMMDKYYNQQKFYVFWPG